MGLLDWSADPLMEPLETFQKPAVCNGVEDILASAICAATSYGATSA